MKRRCKNVYFTENVNLARIDYVVEHDGKYIKFDSNHLIKYCPFCGGIIKTAHPWYNLRPWYNSREK